MYINLYTVFPSSKLVNMTIFAVRCCHTIRQKSSNVNSIVPSIIIGLTLITRSFCELSRGKCTKNGVTVPEF